MSRDEGKKAGKSTLADQLASLDLDLPREKSSADPPSQRSAEPAPATAEPDPTHQAEVLEALSEEELFRQAIEDMDAAQIYRAKFEGQAAASLPDDPTAAAADRLDTAAPEPTEELAIGQQAIKEARDAALFNQAVGEVVPIAGREKHLRQARRHGPELSTPAAKENRRLLTPPLPMDGEGLHALPRHDAAQRALKKRHDRLAKTQTIPELYLRGNTREEALRLLEEFVLHQWREETPFLRIVHGRGLRSEAEPVLKPAILAWLEGPGARFLVGYIPQRNHVGDYGSLILELTRPAKK